MDTGKRMRLAPALGISIAVLLLVAQAASAQVWKRQWETDKQPAQRRQQVVPAGKNATPASTCVRSGMTQYTQNCGKNIGGCVPSRGNCNRGWCCP
jgi:hypothetical protein